MEKPLYKAFKYRTCSGFVFRIDEEIGNNYSCSVFWMVKGCTSTITAAASLGAATRNITRADLDATFNMTERPFKGGIYVEDTKKLVLPDVPGFGFIGFDNE